MILLYAVLFGLITGWLRAWYHRGRLVVPELQWLWLVPVAFVPQWLAFFLPVTRGLFSDEAASAILVGSQFLLLLFAWANRRQRAFWWLGLGLLLNLTVIVLNGGLMPISPETLSHLLQTTDLGEWPVGQRAGTSKDVVLPEAATRLAWLSDRFVLPAWLPQRAAFSLGDVFISIGAFWLLWQAGAAPQRQFSAAGST